MGRLLRFLTAGITTVALCTAPVRFTEAPLAEPFKESVATPSDYTQRVCRLFRSTDVQQVLSFYPIPFPEEDPQYKKLIDLLTDKLFVERIKKQNNLSDTDILKFVVLAKLAAHLHVKAKVLEKEQLECFSNTAILPAQLMNLGKDAQEANAQIGARCNSIGKASQLYRTASKAVTGPADAEALLVTTANIAAGLIAIEAPLLGGPLLLGTLAFSTLPSRGTLLKKFYEDELIWLGTHNESAGHRFAEKLVGALIEEGVTSAASSSGIQISPEGVTLGVFSDYAKDAFTDAWGENVLNRVKAPLEKELASIREDAYRIPGLSYGYTCNRFLSPSEAHMDQSAGLALPYLQRRDDLLTRKPNAVISLKGKTPFKTTDAIAIAHDPSLKYCPVIRKTMEKELESFASAFIYAKQGNQEKARAILREMEKRLTKRQRDYVWGGNNFLCYPERKMKVTDLDALAALAYLAAGETQTAVEIKKALEIKRKEGCCCDDCKVNGCDARVDEDFLMVALYAETGELENANALLAKARLRLAEQVKDATNLWGGFKLDLEKFFESVGSGGFYPYKNYREYGAYKIYFDFIGHAYLVWAIANYAVGEREKAMKMLKLSEYVQLTRGKAVGGRALAHAYMDRF